MGAGTERVRCCPGRHVPLHVCPDPQRARHQQQAREGNLPFLFVLLIKSADPSCPGGSSEAEV